MSQTITVNKPRRIKPTTLAAIGFAAPLIIYMLIFYVWPLIQNISMSMHRYTRRTFVTGDAPWSGFDIYKEILSNQQFWTILGQTLIFVFASIVFQYSIGLALAVFFNQNFKLSAALRGAFLVPWLLPPMISGTIWQWMMDADSGVINNFLKIIYLSKIAVLISLKMFCAGCPCIQSEKSTSIQFVVFRWKSAPNFVNNSFVLLLFATNNACKPLNICSFSFFDSIDLSKVKFSSMIIPPFLPCVA